MPMVPSTRATLEVTSALLVMFRKKIWAGPEKSKNVAKTAKIEGYNTRFWTSPRFELRTPRDASEGHGVHWKWVMWLGTNIWMPLCSFRGNFRFHVKWTNGVFRGFSRQHKWCQETEQRYKSRSAILGTFQEKIWPGPEMSKNVPKTAKIEGYNTRFRTFRRFELRASRDAS